jgi:DNA-binding CsgD family transcriptional regulator
MTDFAALRPLERRVIRLAESGVVPDEIGRRFNRSGAFIERVLVLADLPGRSPVAAREPLRPLERRLLQWRARGASYEELADRFVRGPGHIERVIRLAEFKQQRAGTAQ